MFILFSPTTDSSTITLFRLHLRYQPNTQKQLPLQYQNIKTIN